MKLLSFEFLAVALSACLLLPLTRGILRDALFLAINGAFAWSYLGATGAIVTSTFLLLGFGVANFVRGGGTARTVTGVALLTAIFIYLRGYDLIRYVLPENWIHQGLAAAGLSFLFFKVIHVVLESASGGLDGLRFTPYLHYALNFTTFLMGPIQRYPDFAGQWASDTGSIAPGFDGHLDALTRVVRGLVKKFVLAETLAPWILTTDMAQGSDSALKILLGLYAFYLYLYCDFSGYCDVMIGVGSLMGVRPPENFHLPFFSRNVSEYWLRVHRSLTTWLTDYVFTPTYAGALRKPWFQRNPFAALSLALIVTMLVSGLWHGTTLAFLCFGLVHAVYLVTFRGYELLGRKALGPQGFRTFSQRHWVRGVAILLTFHLTATAYIFFVLDADAAWRLVQRFLQTS